MSPTQRGESFGNSARVVADRLLDSGLKHLVSIDPNESSGIDGGEVMIYTFDARLYRLLFFTTVGLRPTLEPHVIPAHEPIQANWLSMDAHRINTAEISTEETTASCSIPTTGVGPCVNDRASS